MWLQVNLPMAHLKSLSIGVPPDEELGFQRLSSCFGNSCILETINKIP